MKLLQKAENSMAYLKAGIFGFQGAGKTFTATAIACGLHKHIGSKKPVAFFDTETGSSFVLHTFKDSDIELLTVKSRAFKDVCEFIREAEKECDIAIIDSITHVWRDLVDSYMRANRRKFLRIQDWGPLKKTWAEYSTLYVNSPLHIIMCGRAGNVFEDVQDDENDSSSWKAVKVGTKMSAETETGYEPSLLLEMFKEYVKDGGLYQRSCHVIKDRFDVIDSKTFVNPTFADFRPHIDLLNVGGAHVGIDSERNSTELFDDDGNPEWKERERRRKIALEKIQNDLVKVFPASTGAEKTAKLRIIEAVLNTTSWTEIEGMHPDHLESSMQIIRAILKDAEVMDGLTAKPKDWDPAPLQERVRTERQIQLEALNGGKEEVA